jgi:hypothetical protein
VTPFDIAQVLTADAISSAVAGSILDPLSIASITFLKMEGAKDCFIWLVPKTLVPKKSEILEAGGVTGTRCLDCTIAKACCLSVAISTICGLRLHPQK